MKTFGYIPCHQHREMDILLHGCLEVGVTLVHILGKTIGTTYQDKKVEAYDLAICLPASSLEKYCVQGASCRNAYEKMC